MAIHREWVTPPKAHKACKDTIKSKWYEKPCDYCGRPLRVQINAVLIPKFHKKCAAKAKEEISSVKSATEESLNVFLCHSSSDKPHIRKLFQRLRSAGVKPWLDEENLLLGQDWHYEIIKAVRNSHAVIVCLSKTSISKAGYIQKEIKYALDVADEQPEGTIFLIPLKLEECDTPDRLKRWQWVKLFDQGGYDKLLCSLNERARSLGMSQIAELIKPRTSNVNSDATIGFLEKLNMYKEGIDTFEFLNSVKSDFYFSLWDPADPWENIDTYLSKLQQMGLIRIENKLIFVTTVGREYIESHKG